MTAPRVIPPDVLHRQIDASNPAVSAWVSANAGSGKTHVLAQRVIRLLLDGIAPEKILCITFTKAAAANMAKRVFDTLGQWTAHDDAKLDEAIRAISNVRPDPAVRARARRLFALALETPGGLKVQTIHAFCTRLLHQFPFEANVAARFEVLDETSEKQILEQVTVDVLLKAAAEPEGPIGRALTTAITFGADRTLKEVIREAIGKRNTVRAWIDHDGSIEGAVAALCTAFNIEPDDTVERVDAETVGGPNLPRSQWAAAAAAFDGGSKTDREQAGRLREAANSDGEDRARIYRSIFLTDVGEQRSRILTKAVENANAGLAERLSAERDRVFMLAERRKKIVCRDRTGALLAISAAVIDGYETAKDRRGVLDYDDLIDRTLTMLENVDSAWVHYKLDRGIDHVLIDEAQDTSPRQWQIIRALVAEFFAGEGAREVKRTIFAVGDEKQSIFSFQGAAPRQFDEMRHAFAGLCLAVKQELQYVRFLHSFRSGPNLLAAVDTVFARPQAFGGLSADNVATVHEHLPEAAPGFVEVWDTTKPDEKREIEAWQAPFDNVTETSPQARLALKIARSVKRWRDAGTRPGDVLVLVRQRGPLFESIIRSLKDEGIAVAGADRLVLTEHIAVMDLMVLADALLLENDDLALATALKSPLFGFNDDNLYTIAWKREGSLRTALRHNNEPHFAAAAATLDRYAEWARRDMPFGFFARVLGAERGRARMLARLGPEADDALDEFLNLALDYERRETPSLQGFIAWLRSARTDVKRDMEIARDEVRVMTVHGAKGLEAPVVILADTTTPPAGPAQRQPKLLALASDGAPDRLIWAGAKATDFALVSSAREASQKESANEYRRLLYVAMTRAIERLVVCGFDGATKRPENCWYDLVSQALESVAVREPADDGDGQVWRFRKSAVGARPSDAPHPPKAAQGAPPWLHRDVAAEPAAPAPLSPSSAHDEATVVRRPGVGAERRVALMRGTHTHRLLQALPAIAPADRAEAARRYIEKVQDFSTEERAEIVGHALKLLADARFAPLFEEGGRAEVPIVGRIVHNGHTLIVSGQVDRLVVGHTDILIADYKTNRPIPEKVPEPYVAQLALYRAVLRQLYPDHAVRAALIWTYVPDLVEISTQAMDAALARLRPP